MTYNRPEALDDTYFERVPKLSGDTRKTNRESLLRAIDESLPVGVYAVDEKAGNILFFNNKFCEMWGITHLRDSMRNGALNNLDIAMEIVSRIKSVKPGQNSKGIFKHCDGPETVIDEFRLADERLIRCNSARLHDFTEYDACRLYTFEEIVQHKPEACTGACMRYEGLIDELPLIAFEMDVKGNITSLSPNAHRVLGCTPDEFSAALNVFSIIAPEDRDMLEENIRCVADRKEIGHEYTIVTKDGRRITGMIYASPVYEGDTLVSLRGIIADISSRKKAEEKLRENEERFRSIMNSTMDAILTINGNGVITFWNDAAEKLFGYTWQEATGQSLTMLMPEHYRNAFNMARMNSPGSGKVAHLDRIIELEGLKKDGTVFPFEMSLSLSRENEVSRFCAVIRDITERRKMQEDLRLLSAAIECSPSSIMINDIAGRVVYVNAKFTAVTGYTSQEAVGQSTSILKSANVSSEDLRSMIKTVTMGRDWHGDIRFRRKSGEEYWAAARVAPIQDSRGLATHFVYTSEDITERKLAENQILLNERRLESLLRISEHKAENIQELLDFALDEAITLTGSKIGYIYHYDEQNCQFILNTWSNGVMKECTITNPETKYDLDKTGIWGEAVRQRKSIIINNFEADHPLKKGYPAGHTPLKSFLTIPVFELDRIVAVVGVANKDKDYEHSDVLQLTLLMNSVWGFVERKRAEEKLSASLREKEILLKEIHHRVKNNLQIISSLLSLQSPKINEMNAAQMLKESRDRVRSIALIHEKMYQTNDLSMIDFGEYTRSLTDYLIHSYSIGPGTVTIDVEGDNINMSPDKAVPCGLIISELVSNCFKHAFPEGRTGKVKIGLRHGEIMTVSVSDDGVGLPEDFRLENTTSMGIQLVTMLAEQLEGSVAVERVGGTKFTIVFPAEEH